MPSLWSRPDSEGPAPAGGQGSGLTSPAVPARDVAVRDMAVPAGGGGSATAPPFLAGRFLSAAECQALTTRVAGFAVGGGTTTLFVASRWTGNIRWARNRVLYLGDVRNNDVALTRHAGGVQGQSDTNTLDARRLRLAVRRAERVLEFQHEVAEALRPEPPLLEAYPTPPLWFDRTYQVDGAQRAEVMRRVVQPAEAAGMLSAGYLQVRATGWTLTETGGGRVWYYPYTEAEYTVTVRAPDGSASGWAGLDHNDWAKIDTEQLSAIALEKCLRSRNPVRLEPGRYTTILEPQAVGDLVCRLFSLVILDRPNNEGGDPNDRNFIRRTDPRYKPNPRSVYNDGPGYSKLGERIMDERVTVTTDCMDPALGFPPFSRGGVVYHPVTWIKDGVLANLAYGPDYALKQLGLGRGIYQWGDTNVTGAFHLTARGETASVEEMIATTKRGLLVTRFWGIPAKPDDAVSALYSGYTRDGLWLIEDGKINKPVKNFRFRESPLFVLNNIEQVGVPQRIYSPVYPIVVPALKVRDFNFVALSDSI